MECSVSLRFCAGVGKQISGSVFPVEAGELERVSSFHLHPFGEEDENLDYSRFCKTVSALVVVDLFQTWN